MGKQPEHMWTLIILVHKINVWHPKENVSWMWTTEILTCFEVWLKAVKKLPSWIRSKDATILLNTSLNTDSFPNTPESGCKMNCAFCSLDSKPNTATCRTKYACHTFCTHQVYKQTKVVVQQCSQPRRASTVNCKPQEMSNWSKSNYSH